MSHDDLSSWLKVVAENKITTKNTWKSTLIEHFKDIKQFKNIQGINFQKASCTLDGCIKVYSTRVDDVSEEAMKLLEGFNLEDVKKKASRKKGIKTIETNISNINIKNNHATAFRDSVFLSLDKKGESILLLSTLDICKDGVFRMYSTINKSDSKNDKRDKSKSEGDRDIKMCTLKIDKLNLDDKPICPTFSKMGEFEDLVEMEMEPPLQEVDYDCTPGDFDYVEEDIKSVRETPFSCFKETPFSYFKGWAGPTHWRIRTSRMIKNSSSSKSKEKFILNFTDPFDKDLILIEGDTLIDPSMIESRKEVNNSLPEDYNLEIEDLYTYNILEGRIRSDEPILCDLVDEPNLDEPNIIIDEPVDEIYEEEVKIQYTFRREQKKVDIKRLKNNILSNIKSSKDSKLSQICKEVPKMYDMKEKKDISIHFCIVSLLHVANERNLELVLKDNDVFISNT